MILTICGGIFIVVVGCLFHFLYEWTHHNKFIGFFAAVNESTWEHLKLLMAPSYLWLIVEYFVYDGNLAVFLAHFLGLVSGMILVPVIFYIYKALFRRDVLAIDILAFVLGAALEQVMFYWLINVLPQNDIIKNVGIAGLILLFIVYLTQTYAPLHNFLSRDPITKKYGVAGHWDGKKRKNKRKLKH